MEERTKLEAALDELIEGKSAEEIAGPGGLLKQLTKALLERAMNAELTQHLGYAKNEPEGRGSGNSRNGRSRKQVQGDFGKVEIEVPGDRNGSFEPRDCALNGVRFALARYRSGHRSPFLASSADHGRRFFAPASSPAGPRLDAPQDRADPLCGMWWRSRLVAFGQRRQGSIPRPHHPGLLRCGLDRCSALGLRGIRPCRPDGCRRNISQAPRQSTRIALLRGNLGGGGH